MDSTWVLIPAAGDSRRMGRPKALLPVEGRPAFAHVFDEARRAGCCGGTLLTSAALVPELGRLPAGLEHVPVPEPLRPEGEDGACLGRTL